MSALQLASPLRATVVLALALVAAGGCTSCTDEAGSESLSDSSAAAGHDAGSGASTSSTTSSAAGGAPPVPFEGWERLAGVPAYCEVYVASHPEQLPALSWVPCSDGTPGCTELEIDWPASPDENLFYVGSFTGAPTEAGPLLVIDRRLGSDLFGWRELVMAYADGPVLAALRSMDPIATDEPCRPGAPAVGAGRVVAGVRDKTPEYPDNIIHELQVPLSGGVPTVFSTLSKETLHGNIIADRSPGESFVAVSYSPGTKILTVPYDGSAPTVVAAFSLEKPWTPEQPVTVGDDVLFWARFEGRFREYVYHSATSSTELLLDVAEADVLPARTDGQTLMWILSYPPLTQSQTPSQVELWSSPLASTPAGLAPEKVAELAASLRNVYALFQSGLVVLRHSSWSRNYVLRLADKAYWTLDAPAGSWWGRTLYATADEVAIPVQPPYDQTDTFTIRRQQLAALGPPTPVQGVLGEP